MGNNEKYLVGFDRFIAIEWADFALELASQNDTESDQKISILKEWLAIKVKGKDSIRKTANVLTRLWIDTDSEVTYLKTKALQLYPQVLKEDRIVLHWGMALVAFPLFRETVLQIGRILSLQESFQRIEVHRRVVERYSNQGTIPRSVDRIIQSLVNWEILSKAGRSYSSAKSKAVAEKIQAWLVDALLLAQPEHRILVNDLFRTPELFPFDFQGNHRASIYSSELFTVERDGTNLEFVVPSSPLQ